MSGPLYWTDMLEAMRLDPTVGDEQYVNAALDLAPRLRAEVPIPAELEVKR